MEVLLGAFRVPASFMKFLTQAVGLPFSLQPVHARSTSTLDNLPDRFYNSTAWLNIIC